MPDSDPATSMLVSATGPAPRSWHDPHSTLITGGISAAYSPVMGGMPASMA